MIAAAEILARTSEGQKSGPLALAVILVLCVVCYFLFKSMSKHLKRVREEFPADLPPGPDSPIRPAGEQASSAPAEQRAVPAAGPDVTGDGPATGP